MDGIFKLLLVKLGNLNKKNKSAGIVSGPLRGVLLAKLNGTFFHNKSGTYEVLFCDTLIIKQKKLILKDWD